MPLGADEVPLTVDRRPKRRRGLWLALGIAAVALLVGCAWFFSLTPSDSRDWVVDQEQPAIATIDGDSLYLRNVRDFRYDSSGTPIPHYYDASYSLDSVRTAWYVLTEFSKRYRAPAHTFVSFGFADGRYLAISVEARREKGESYGILAGMFRRYELIYVIGDERDLIGRRAAVEGDDTYLYPVNAPPDRIRDMLEDMLVRADSLQEQPEFYNSFLNSCTSNLVRHVNQIAPGKIPAGWKVLVPGYTDDVARSLGLVGNGTDHALVRQHYLINAKARESIATPDFSARIRAGL